MWIEILGGLGMFFSECSYAIQVYHLNRTKSMLVGPTTFVRAWQTSRKSFDLCDPGVAAAVTPRCGQRSWFLLSQ